MPIYVKVRLNELYDILDSKYTSQEDRYKAMLELQEIRHNYSMESCQDFIDLLNTYHS